MALIFALLTAINLYFCAGYLHKNSYLRFVPVLVFLSWGPIHLNYSSATMYAIWGGTLTCLLLLRAKRKAVAGMSLFLAGVTVFLTFLFKQNFGAALILTCFTAFIFNKRLRNRRSAGLIIAGLSLGALVFLLYLWISGSIRQFGENLYFYSFQKIILEGQASTPFIYPGTLPEVFIKTGFYLLPLLVSVTAIFFVSPFGRELLFLPVFCLTYYFLGIRPVTDFIHVAPLLSLSGISLLMLLKTKNLVIKALVGLGIFMTISGGIYTALFWGYFRWGTPILQNNYWLPDKRLAVWVDDKTYREFPRFVNTLNKYSQAGDAVFADYYAPWIYFLTDRKNPTRFDYLNSAFLNPGYEEEIIDSLNRRGVTLIITGAETEAKNNRLNNFIEENYQPVAKEGAYVFWTRRGLAVRLRS